MVLTDLRFVLRNLARTPSLVGAAIVSLALGIGANTAIFTLADQMLLRALPVKDPQRLVLLNWTGNFIGGTSRGQNDTFSYPAYLDLRNDTPAPFAGIAARYQDAADVADHGPAERASVELVSGNFFDVTGVSAAIGRVFTPDDDKLRDGEPYVVLAYNYWRRRFGASPSVLNRVIDVNGHPMTVVGVAQRGFAGFETLSPSDLFMPLSMKKALTPTWDDRDRRDSIWLKVFARLAPGVDVRTAESAIAIPFHAALENDLKANSRDASFAKRYLQDKIHLTSAAKGFSGTQDFYAKPLYVLLAMVGTLLLIAWVNVANLLITRAATRRKEIAIRLSLGATRASLIRLVTLESVVIACASGVLGLVLSQWIAPALLDRLPITNVQTVIHTSPDGRVLAFTAAVSLLSALLFGFLPAFQATRSDLASTLKSEGASLSLGLEQSRLRRLLVMAQVALSLLLIIGAGLFARSLYKLLGSDPGIESTHLLTFSVDPSLHKYSPDRTRRLFVDLKRNLEHIPGIVAASGVSFPLLAQVQWENGINVEGHQRGMNEDMQAGWDEMLPGFFSAVGTPLLAGREFTERDTAGAPKVVIVNETFAKRFFPHGSPLGRRVGLGVKPDREIVGVVKDLKMHDLKEIPMASTFTPVLQDDEPSSLTFYLRTNRNPLQVAQATRQAVSRLDGALTVVDMKTVAGQIDETHFVDRLFAILSAAFGFLATLLASVGLYGTTSHAVTRRTQEIGIRIALGAERGNVLSLIMREVFLLAGIGVAVGLAAAVPLGKVLESQLYGLKADDPTVLAGAIAVILCVCALAGYIPARRATRIDPIRALKYE